MEIDTATTGSTVDGQLSFCGSHGYPVCGSVRSLARTRIEFELFGPSVPLCKGEVLKELKLIWGGEETRLNNVIVDDVITNGLGVVCGATFTRDECLPEDENKPRLDGSLENGKSQQEFLKMLNRWARTQRLPPRFKEAVEDVRSFLAETWSFLQRREVALVTSASSDKHEDLLGIAASEHAALSCATLDRLFGEFESACAQIDQDHLAPARNLCQTHWHPYLMTCPFMHRIYSKPLGYAGDYEMMNMIWRNQPDGTTLFAKFLSAYILNQGPAISVRNRVKEVNRLLMQEIIRVKSSGNSPAVLSVGCGPAREIEILLSTSLGNDTKFQLMDFNEETLSYTKARLEAACRQQLRTCLFEFTKRSVYQLMREQSEAVAHGPQFDVIYSSGLYDYLNDRVSRTVNSRLYDQLRPGGVLFVTNFDNSNPIRNMMEYAFEWCLIHRNGKQMEAMIPDRVPVEDCSIWADQTGINVFLTIRKPVDFQ